MPLFKRKILRPETRPASPGPYCTHCGSGKSMPVTFNTPGASNPVRMWRGKRYLTYRCQDCGRDFYVTEKQSCVLVEDITDEDTIDEDALRNAEAELKNQIKEDGDHTFH